MLQNSCLKLNAVTTDIQITKLSRRNDKSK